MYASVYIVYVLYMYTVIIHSVTYASITLTSLHSHPRSGAPYKCIHHLIEDGTDGATGQFLFEFFVAWLLGGPRR